MSGIVAILIRSTPMPTCKMPNREEHHPPDGSSSSEAHLVRSLGRFLNVTLVIGDATSVTEAGYVGEDVESLLSKVVLATEGDMDIAQRGIVTSTRLTRSRWLAQASRFCGWASNTLS